MQKTYKEYTKKELKRIGLAVGYLYEEMYSPNGGSKDDEDLNVVNLPDDILYEAVRYLGLDDMLLKELDSFIANDLKTEDWSWVNEGEESELV